MQGRLQGKRLTARHFLDEVAEHAAEGCNYLLAVDVEMNPVEGYAMSSWERGYGDFVMRPDLSTLRPAPWLPATALCLTDLAWADGTDVVASPRQVLRRQLERLAERGWRANAGTELEFLVFRDSYEQAWHKGYRDLDPANLYNIDYSLLGTAKVEPLMRRIRNEMEATGLGVENSKGECNLGQHEINFRYEDALRAADQHAIYKNAAKEIADQEGMAISFMAKFNEREGSSCHIHFSIADADGPLFDRDRGHLRALPRRPARLPAGADAAAGAERQLLQALRGRFVRAHHRRLGARQPHLLAAGRRARSGAALREPRRRVGPQPVPGAGRARSPPGCTASSRSFALEPEFEGNAYLATDHPRLPTTLREARDLFAASEVARAALGEEVVDHYVHAADVELAAFESAVTDWERLRGFERL